MVEEWVVRDTLGGALQRGLDPDEVARGLTFRGYRGSWLDPAPKDPLREGDSGPRPDDHRAECELVLGMIGEVWNGRHLNKVPEYFQRDLFLDTVGDVTITRPDRSEEHTSELQSRQYLVCRLLLEKKKKAEDNVYSNDLV